MERMIILRKMLIISICLLSVIFQEAAGKTDIYAYTNAGMLSPVVTKALVRVQ